MLRQADCDPGAVLWIQRYFGDCVYNARDMLGFSVGLASICCWLVAQMPQLYRNYKTKSADALSPWFLAEWLLGDTCNLLGALLKGDQLPTVVFTAQYFICVDAVMMVQFLYYMSLQRRLQRQAAGRRHRHHHHRRHSHQQQHSSGSTGLGPHAQLQQPHEQLHGSEIDGQGLGGAGAAHEHADLDADGEIVGGAVGSSAGASTDAGANSSSFGGSRVPAVVAGGGRDVAFRPHRTLACLGALLLVAHLQPAAQQRQQWQPIEAAGLASGGAAPAAAEAAAGTEAGHGAFGRRRLLQATAALGSSGGGSGWGSLFSAWSYTAGSVLAYCSSVLYLTSRLSQIWKNHNRRSAEGLAISMFLCAIAANSLYGSSILIRSYNWEELSSSLPWLIGSLGTVALDLSIFMQARVLGTGREGQKHHPSDEDEPLLQP